MTPSDPANLAISIHNRLLNLARFKQLDFNHILIRYALERFLFRISGSRYHHQFILKGAMLFQVWTGSLSRPTRDIDLLGFGPNEANTMNRIMTEICEIESEPDGLRWISNEIQVDPIKETADYQGLRVKLQAMLGTARIPIQLDIGFGDALALEPDQVEFPTLLKSKRPVIRAYRRETVIAEKYQAMILFGVANSRMKDFYDIWKLSQLFEFNGIDLSESIRLTFQNRKTLITVDRPVTFSSDFYGDRQKQLQWNNYLKNQRLETQRPSLEQVIFRLEQFLMPVTQAICNGHSFTFQWSPLHQWSKCHDS